MVVLSPCWSWHKREALTKLQVRATLSAAIAIASWQADQSYYNFAGSHLLERRFDMASITTYFTFYLISKFHISVQSAQIHLFFFWAPGGRNPRWRPCRRPHWPQVRHLVLDSWNFAFHADTAICQSFLDGVLSVVIGMILSPLLFGNPCIAQELIPGKVGMISGLFFGFAFSELRGGRRSAGQGR